MSSTRVAVGATGLRRRTVALAAARRAEQGKAARAKAKSKLERGSTGSPYGQVKGGKLYVDGASVWERKTKDGHTFQPMDGLAPFDTLDEAEQQNAKDRLSEAISAVDSGLGAGNDGESRYHRVLVKQNMKVAAREALKLKKEAYKREYATCFKEWLLGKNTVLNDPIVHPRGYATYLEQFPRCISWAQDENEMTRAVKVFLYNLYMKGAQTEQEVEWEFRYLVYPVKKALEKLRAFRKDDSVPLDELKGGLNKGEWNPKDSTIVDKNGASARWPLELTWMKRAPDRENTEVPLALHPAINKYMRDGLVNTVSYEEWLNGDFSGVADDGTRELWTIVANRLWSRDDRMQAETTENMQGKPQFEGSVAPARGADIELRSAEYKGKVRAKKDGKCGALPRRAKMSNAEAKAQLDPLQGGSHFSVVEGDKAQPEPANEVPKPDAAANAEESATASTTVAGGNDDAPSADDGGGGGGQAQKSQGWLDWMLGRDGSSEADAGVVEAELDRPLAEIPATPSDQQPVDDDITASDLPEIPGGMKGDDDDDARREDETRSETGTDVTLPENDNNGGLSAVDESVQDMATYEEVQGEDANRQIDVVDEGTETEPPSEAVDDDSLSASEDTKENERRRAMKFGFLGGSASEKWRGADAREAMLGEYKDMLGDGYLTRPFTREAVDSMIENVDNALLKALGRGAPRSWLEGADEAVSSMMKKALDKGWATAGDSRAYAFGEIATRMAMMAPKFVHNDLKTRAETDRSAMERGGMNSHEAARVIGAALLIEDPAAQRKELKKIRALRKLDSLNYNSYVASIAAGAYARASDEAWDDVDASNDESVARENVEAGEVALLHSALTKVDAHVAGNVSKIPRLSKSEAVQMKEFVEMDGDLWRPYAERVVNDDATRLAFGKLLPPEQFVRFLTKAAEHVARLENSDVIVKQTMQRVADEMRQSGAGEASIKALLKEAGGKVSKAVVRMAGDAAVISANEVSQAASASQIRANDAITAAGENAMFNNDRRWELVEEYRRRNGMLPDSGGAASTDDASAAVQAQITQSESSQSTVAAQITQSGDGSEVKSIAERLRDNPRPRTPTKRFAIQD